MSSSTVLFFLLLYIPLLIVCHGKVNPENPALAADNASQHNKTNLIENKNGISSRNPRSCCCCCNKCCCCCCRCPCCCGESHYKWCPCCCCPCCCGCVGYGRRRMKRKQSVQQIIGIECIKKAI